MAHTVNVNLDVAFTKAKTIVTSISAVVATIGTLYTTVGIHTWPWIPAAVVALIGLLNTVGVYLTTNQAKIEAGAEVVNKLEEKIFGKNVPVDFNNEAPAPVVVDTHVEVPAPVVAPNPVEAPVAAAEIPVADPVVDPVADSIPDVTSVDGSVADATVTV